MLINGVELEIKPYSDLSVANLFRANLSRADLSMANLYWANLFRADLSGANLSRADLSMANLYWANLSRAYLSWANLSGANLTMANLSVADLSRADLSGANLYEANLSGANLSEANLSRAKLSRAKLSRAKLSEANLSWADLSMANLSEANLFRAYLSEANLSWANLSRANLSWADLSGAKNIPLVFNTFLPGVKYTAFKAVTKELKSIMVHGHIGIVLDYSIGNIVTVKNANTDRRELCAEGINVAYMEYIAKYHMNDKIVLVEFSGQDVAAIPYASDGKFRLHRCTVIREVTEEVKRYIEEMSTGQMMNTK